MMDLKAAMAMLDESQGSNVNNIYIPTFGKELPFKPLTTGQQKSISKFSIDMEGDFNIDEEFIKLALFDSLIMDKSYKSDRLTEIDMLAFFAGLRALNIVAPLVLNITCYNEECGKEFKTTVDLNDIIEKCKKYKAPEVEFEKTIDGVVYKFILSDPTFRNQIEFEQYMKMIEEQDIMGNVNDFRLFTTPAIYIKSVSINGEIITDFKDSHFIEKLNFYEKLNGELTITTSDEKAKDCLLLQLLDHFGTESKESLFNKISCPYCKNEVEGVITYDNFFII